jgi:hypothetical protein
MLCAVCTVHKEMRSTCFLVESQNQGRRFVSCLSSKPLGRFISGLASKPLKRFLPIWSQNRWQRVSRFESQNRQLRFGDLGLKITVTVSWLGPQNQVGCSLPITPQNRQDDEDGTGHASRSSSLLCMEASRARVSQSGLKTGGGVAQMVHVAPSWRSHEDQVKDGWVDAMGCVGPCYPYFAIFHVLGHRGILVFLIFAWAYN